jgi:ribosome-binding protein aMBF1 (putative translation factor)
MITADDIRELRRRRNWTHRELADSVFASELSAIRWESGTTVPRPAVSRRLAEMLEASRIRDARMAARKPRRSKA